MIKLRNIIAYSGVCLISLLNSKAQPRLVVPVGHTEDVTDAVFSPDSKFLATISEDNTVKIWNTTQGKLIQTLFGHTSAVTACQFSKDGNYLSSLSKDDSITYVWNINTGIPIAKGSYTGGEFIPPYFSYSGKYVVISIPDGMVVLSLKNLDTIRKFSLIQPRTNYKVFDCIAISRNDQYIAAATSSDSIFIWDILSGKSIRRFDNKNSFVNDVHFLPDNQTLLSVTDYQLTLNDFKTGKLVYEVKLDEDKKHTLIYDDNYKVTLHSEADSEDSNDEEITTIQTTIIDCKQKKAIRSPLDILPEWFRRAEYSHTGNYIGFPLDSSFSIMQKQGANYKRIFSVPMIPWIETNYDRVKGSRWIYFSPNGKMVITNTRNNDISLWNVDGKLRCALKGSIVFDKDLDFDDDGQFVYTSSGRKNGFWNIALGKFMIHNSSNKGSYYSPWEEEPESYALELDSISLQWVAIRDDKKIYLENPRDSIPFWAWKLPDGKTMMSYFRLDSTIHFWSLETGKHLSKGKIAFIPEYKFSFNPGITQIAVKETTMLTSEDLDKMWDDLELELDAENMNTEDSLEVMKKVNAKKTNVKENKTYDVDIIDLLTGKPVFQIHDTIWPSQRYSVPSFTNSSNYFILATTHLQIWDTRTWEKILDVPMNCDGWNPGVSFDSTGKKVLVSCRNMVSLFETKTSKLFFSLPGTMEYAQFSSDENLILTTSAEKQLKIWNAQTGALLYTYYAFENNDFLVLDNFGRYDGSEKARKELYYICGDEIIDLDQFKQLGWQPGLAGKIMGADTKPITVKKISEINICNVTPVIEEQGFKDGAYHFKITPRSGGIGEVQVYVRVSDNDKPVTTYELSSLVKSGNSYLLNVKQSDVWEFFVSGTENQVVVKATTENGMMNSRGGSVTVVSNKKEKPNPDIYIVSIGISQYKGEKLNLAYASKDAQDFASTLTLAAKKLLNIDGKEHVNSFTFSTSEEGHAWPAKSAIVKTLDSIAKRSRADDILVLFFAGHGVLKGGQNLYLLTADASAFELEGVEKEVAISFNELKSWMQKIRANKQIVILDACNSGQVVQSLKEMLAKRDVPDDQKRALEELKDQTGTYILSASASGQAAYETSLYGQGLLTYCLLSGIKLGDGLEDNKYIDVTNWFNTALRQVKVMATDIGGRQDPQTIGNASLKVGLVDKEVTDGIKLSIKKKVFKRTTLLKEGRIPNDAIGLSQLVDKSLNELAARGKESPLSYIPENTLLDAYSIRGYYNTQGDEIIVKISLIKGEEVEKPLFEFELKGSIENKAELAKKITEEVKNHLNK